MHKLTVSLLGSALFAFGLSSTAVAATEGGATPANASPIPATETVKTAPKPVDRPVAEMMQDRVLGNPDAPIKIYEYGSLTCSHCAHFQAATFPTLKKNFIDTGRVQFVLRNFPLNRPDLDATMITHCIAPEKFYSFTDVLMASQAEWAFNKDGYMPPLRQYARFAGMDEASLDKCLTNKDLLTAIIERRQKASSEFDINSTPTFIIEHDGKQTKVKGAQDAEYFAKILNDMLD